MPTPIKRGQIILPSSYTPPLRKTKRWITGLSLAFVILVLLTVIALAARHYTAPSAKNEKWQVSTDTTPSKPLYTIELEWPTHLTVGMWGLVKVTVTSQSAGQFALAVPAESNATIQPLQAQGYVCIINPNTSCINEWAVKATAPGDITFHVLPTVRLPNSKKPFDIRYDIRTDPIQADESTTAPADVTWTIVQNVLTALSLVAGLAASILNISDSLARRVK